MLRRIGEIVIMSRTRVIKRNGEEVEFNPEKISNAIQKANKEVEEHKSLTLLQIADVTNRVSDRIESASHAVNVENIQDMVEVGIMQEGGYEIAQKYVRYRYQREIARKANTTDSEILSLIECNNEEVNQVRSVKTLRCVSCCRRRLWTPTKKASSIFTIRIIMPRKSITVI